MSQFFFAWVSPGTPWSSALQRWDESIISFSIEGSEGDIPSMTMLIKNPYIGLLNPGRLYWGWLAWEDDSAVVHELFYGRLVGIPTDLIGEAVTLKFTARPHDYIRQKQLVAETLKVAPGYDRVFMQSGKLDDPDAILEGYSLLYHVDRLTGVVSVSDICVGEDGTLTYGGGSATYSGLKIHLNQSPLMAIAVQATVSWDQQYRGYFDVIYGQMSTFTGEAFISDWPTTGKSLGGGYHAAVGWAANADGLVDMASSLGNVSGSYKWQNLSKKHQTGDTMTVDVSYSHNALDAYFLQMGGIKTVVWERVQTGIQDAFTVDANGDPAPINIPYQLDVTWMTVIPWTVGFDLTLGYEANRKRNEFLFFTLNADAQPIITDPLITEDTEVLSIQSSNLSAPEIDFVNWNSVSGTHVAVGTVVFPDDPSAPGQTSSQICVTAGTAGTVEPTFSNIAGVTTPDGPNTLVWSSLGSTPPPETGSDWNRYLNIAEGTLLLPLPVIADNLSSVLQPGLLTFPPHGLFINQYRLLTDGLSAPGDTIFECETAGMLIPSGLVFTLGTTPPAPIFNTFANPSGQTMYVCTGAGQTGEYHASFNEAKGATTTDGTVTWTSIGAVTLPIGGWPGMTPARSYFPSDRGLLSVQHLICRARAKLRKRARAVQISWETPFQDAIALTCRMNATISDERITGGVATGKVIAYKLIAQGNTGRLYGEVTIGCTVGNAGSITPVTGTPEYVDPGYVDPGYQHYDGAVLTFGPDDVGFTPPVEQAVDDGIVFPLTYEQAVLTDQFNGSQATEIAAVQEAIFLAQEAAYNSGSSSLTLTGAASTSVSYSHPDYAAIQNTMRNANLLGTGLWYELCLRPLTNGPFSAAYLVQTTTLALPKTIDLAAPSSLS